MTQKHQQQQQKNLHKIMYLLILPCLFNLFNLKFWVILCSVMRAIIIGIGYYTVMWGQIREVEEHEDHGVESADFIEKRIPLLQEEMQV